MSVMTISVLFGLVGLLFVGLSIPLIRQRVPPNPYYGFRTRKTLSDPKIWYEVNRIQGNDLFVAGALITVSSLTMLAIARNWAPEHVVFTLLSVTLLSLVGVAWHGFSVLKRM
jgi:uncharacterized membrane protein